MIYVTLSGMQGHRASVSALDPQLQGLGDDQFSGPPQELYILDSDADDVPSKLEIYVKKTGQFFIEREPSLFVKSTLLLASELGQSKKVSCTPRTRAKCITCLLEPSRILCSSVPWSYGSPPIFWWTLSSPGKPTTTLLSLPPPCTLSPSHLMRVVFPSRK